MHFDAMRLYSMNAVHKVSWTELQTRHSATAALWMVALDDSFAWGTCPLRTCCMLSHVLTHCCADDHMLPLLPLLPLRVSFLPP